MPQHVRLNLESLEQRTNPSTLAPIEPPSFIVGSVHRSEKADLSVERLHDRELKFEQAPEPATSLTLTSEPPPPVPIPLPDGRAIVISEKGIFVLSSEGLVRTNPDSIPSIVPIRRLFNAMIEFPRIQPAEPVYLYLTPPTRSFCKFIYHFGDCYAQPVHLHLTPPTSGKVVESVPVEPGLILSMGMHCTSAVHIASESASILPPDELGQPFAPLWIPMTVEPTTLVIPPTVSVDPIDDIEMEPIISGLLTELKLSLDSVADVDISALLSELEALAPILSNRSTWLIASAVLITSVESARWRVRIRRQRSADELRFIELHGVEV